MTSLTRFRHPCSGEPGGHAVCHCWRRAKCRLSGSGAITSGVGWLPAGTYERCRGESTVVAYCSVVTDSSHGWVELLEQGQKSGDFCELLRWSVSRHWLLRSRWSNSRRQARTRQSALTLIAFQARTIRCWFDLLG